VRCNGETQEIVPKLVKILTGREPFFQPPRPTFRNDVHLRPPAHPPSPRWASQAPASPAGAFSFVCRACNTPEQCWPGQLPSHCRPFAVAIAREHGIEGCCGAVPLERLGPWGWTGGRSSRPAAAFNPPPNIPAAAQIDVGRRSPRAARSGFLGRNRALILRFGSEAKLMVITAFACMWHRLL
jgi:hypothetical protein